MGSAAEKVKSLERIDEEIVGPLLDALASEPDWRFMIAPDHPTLVSTRAHSPDPPIFCCASKHAPLTPTRRFCEADAQGGIFVQNGHLLMGTFLNPAADLSQLVKEHARHE